MSADQTEANVSPAATDVNGVLVGLAPRLNTDTRSYKILVDAAGDSMSYAIDPARQRGVAGSLCAAVAFELDVKAVTADKTKLYLYDMGRRRPSWSSTTKWTVRTPCSTASRRCAGRERVSWPW